MLEQMKELGIKTIVIWGCKIDTLNYWLVVKLISLFPHIFSYD
jgi:hypothetical protein